MSIPSVTVLMPVRDAASTVAEAARSILEQDHGDFELLVVDDGSVDGSGEQVEGLGNPRVRVRRLPAPRGLVGALNAGLAEARGPLLARMDADDLAHPERLARQVRALDRNPDVGVCDSRVEIFRDDGPVMGGFSAYQSWLDGIANHADFQREFLVENPVVHPASMSRTALLHDVGGYRDGPFPEDYNLWLRCLRRGARFHKLGERLLRWQDHNTRLTRADDRYARSAFVRLKWDHLRRTRIRPGLRIAVWGAGPSGRPWRRAVRESNAELVAVFDIDPKKIGRTRQGVRVRPVEDVTSVAFDLLLVAVGARGARALIRAQLEATHLEEPRDVIFVA